MELAMSHDKHISSISTAINGCDLGTLATVDVSNIKLAIQCLPDVAENSVASEDPKATRHVKPFPALPHELVLSILEAAARSDKSSAAALALVSRHVHTVALPSLFKTLVLRRRRDVHALRRFLCANARVAAHVRAVFLRESTAADYRLLVSCRGLVRLAVLPGCLTALCGYGNRESHDGDGDDDNDGARARLPLSAPRELLLFPGCTDWRDFDVSAGYTRAFFGGLTHLWLTQPSQLQALMDSKEVVAALSRLTHLATPLFGLAGTEHKIIDAFPALLVLVVTLPAAYRRDSCPWYPRTMKDWLEQSSLVYLRDKRVRVVRFPDVKVEDALLRLWREGKENIWEWALTSG